VGRSLQGPALLARLISRSRRRGEEVPEDEGVAGHVEG